MHGRKRLSLQYIKADHLLCASHAGMTGKLCKHQMYLHRHLDIPLPNMLLVTAAELFHLAQLALGDKCPAEESLAAKWIDAVQL